MADADAINRRQPGPSLPREAAMGKRLRQEEQRDHQSNGSHRHSLPPTRSQESGSGDHDAKVSTDMTFTSVLLSLALQATTPAAAAPPSPKPFDCAAPEYRQFDFWVGEWDVVTNPATQPANAPPAQPGRKPASNVIEKLEGGCVIKENWDDRTGGTGQSFNLYDRVSQRWHQTWVDSTGSLHQYWGGLRDGNMVLVGEVPLPPGARFQGRRTIRVSFMPMGADKVRQFSEALNSDGTWSVNYDLIYTRRAKTK
jgi:hypothetical protein